MKNLSSVFLIASLLVASLSANHAWASQVYKWTDEEGNTHFSQFPPEEKAKAKKLNVKTPQGNTQAGKEQLGNLRKQLSLDIEARNQRKIEQEEENKKAESLTKQCNAAKSNLRMLKQGGRIYRMDENGERKYYSNKELAERVKETQKTADKYCK